MTYGFARGTKEMLGAERLVISENGTYTFSRTMQFIPGSRTQTRTGAGSWNETNTGYAIWGGLVPGTLSTGSLVVQWKGDGRKDWVYALSDQPLEFERRVIRTTGGTSIQAVLQHVLEHLLKQGPPAAQCDVLILTDGYFDRPRAETVRALEGQRVRINLGVIGDGPLHDMERWVTSSVRLPANSQGTN